MEVASVTMKRAITVTVNGQTHHSEVEPRMLLVHYLRETLDLTGTHVDMPFKTEKLWNIIHQK